LDKLLIQTHNAARKAASEGSKIDLITGHVVPIEGGMLIGI
jgi:hypothetical protein